MIARLLLTIIGLLVIPVGLFSQATESGLEANGVRPLLVPANKDRRSLLPTGARLLDDASEIEAFLEEVDRSQPDWAAVYGADGHGHSLDERLFALNRQRDNLREGNKVLGRLVTFLWPAALSSYEPRSGGFRLAIGPKMIPTRWGLVRFKPEGLPSNVMVIPSPALREAWRGKGELTAHIEITVAMTGRLVPEESIIYDFAHEEPGRGLIMPVVRVQRLDYLLAR